MENFSDSYKYISNGMKNSYDGFINFLVSKNIIGIGLAFIISTNINNLASNFIDNIISPIIQKIRANSDKKLKDVKFDIFGIKFEIGDFIMTLLKFIITMIFVYIIYKLIGGEKSNKEQYEKEKEM